MDLAGGACVAADGDEGFQRPGHRSPRLREDEPLGGNPAEDRYVDYFTQLDLTTSYRLSRNWELFGEILNVTNEPFRVHFSESQGRFVQLEEYGITANFGVRWKL